ncbi:hypothetical protein CC1G_00902 [Coprinopsis cinerea okayama7|uniref:Uncharacterized protein n=1 Tax=Coprinopsis cinerea (strain Okayama-7 / 130 / ATCC MYA-4618 / FGSC 9003) TaxID=240176 RepID=A8N927_COPC7|nr:hypothetical protein CC1G_00902 [Coprinopsis cinerea okayama7\|eukprot:XP_001831355.2 hypothetical protein CC1G_00902 [Coprinopsis cinerea okayama7\
MALSAAPVKPKGPLPGLRMLHVLVTGFLSVAIIGISVKASDVLRRNRWTCYRRPDLYPDLDCPLPTIAFARYIPFLTIAAGGVLVCFINLLRHCMFQFRTSSKWILAESVAGLLGWTAVAIATGVENFREGGREEREIGQKCTAHYLYYHQPERGSRGHFVYCVAQDLTWALTCAVALNYLWGLGLWYLTRREEKRRERFTAGVYALNLMYDQDLSSISFRAVTHPEMASSYSFLSKACHICLVPIIACQATVLASTIYVSQDSPFCNTLCVVYLFPFLLISPCGIITSLINIGGCLSHRNTAPWRRWTIIEACLGLLAWAALAGYSGWLADIGDRSECTGHLEDPSEPRARLPTFFSACVWGKLLWASCLVAAIGYLARIGLFIAAATKRRSG